MRRLLLLRHAKSDWDHPGLRDHDRPLAPRGLRAAPRMGRLLRENGLVPGAALASTAVRARETARLALGAAEASPDALRLVPELYGASPGEILAVVEDLGGTSPLLVVAHNPGMEDLVARLAGAWDPFPTAALAVVATPSWDALAADGRLEEVVRPKELNGKAR